MSKRFSSGSGSVSVTTTESMNSLCRSSVAGSLNTAWVAATHAVFSDPATQILQSDAVDEVVVTDTLPVPEEKRFDKLTILPIAPLLAQAIDAVFNDESVTSMFDGAA